MTSVIEIEQAAAKLRRYLKLARRRDLKLICGLRFFDFFRDNQAVSPESYLREFLPLLAEAAGKCNPREFFPEDALSLARLIALVADQSQRMPVADDLTLLRKLDSSLAAGASGSVEIAAEHKNAIRVPCLFVEYYPDLDLPPRGRMLDLYVTASPISTKAETDDIVVRNPVSEPDDRFLAQARDSVTAARKYLTGRYGLSSKKKYRFDFAVDSTGARFTGDSLGAAFAVGAVAAVAQIEVFRERLSISSLAAFSGALTPGGKLNQIDAGALKLKIYRAFHSDLKLLVIPREHITDAWAYLSELEALFPGRKLELVGAESLEAVASDPRLVPPERFSTPAYFARRAWHAKRSAWVEFPAALALAAILFYIIAPASWMPGFDWRIDHLEVMGNRFRTVNPDGKTIWVSGGLKYVIDQKFYDNNIRSTDKKYLAMDIDNDKKDELFFIPASLRLERLPAEITIFDHNGRVMWTRPMFEEITYRYDDDQERAAVTSYVPVFMVPTILNDTELCILTTASASYPARTQVLLYGIDGRKRSGPYLQTGLESIAPRVIDIDHDGRPEVTICAYNRRCMRGALVVLDPSEMTGVSPPYDDSMFIASGMNRGSQKWYVLFPQTGLAREGNATASVEGLRFTDSRTCQVTVFYGGGMAFRTVGSGDEKAPPSIPLDFILDENFIPIDILVPDNTIEYFNFLFSDIGKPQISDVDAWRKQLLSDIIVYRGDSIVHHLAAGIDYYGQGKSPVSK